MKLSVIVPCFNAEATLGETLASLARQRWDQPWEVVVVDNRSTDGSRAIAEGYRARLPNLRIVCACERQGQPHALNRGVALARGEAVALCDADDVVGEGWLRAMGEALARHAFVAARVDTERLNAGWVRKTRGHSQARGLIPYNYPPYLPHASGSTLGFTRALFAAVGPFDEGLPYLHDTDFCWRAQLAGAELRFVPEAVLHMRFRGDLRALYRQARNYAEYNVLLYKRYRSQGMPVVSLGMSLRSWWGMLARLPRIRDKGSFGLWLWFFAQRVGRLQGCIKYRVLAL
ncbi:MAG TPA: glycosyltransferase family 2 protein [Chloroflexaceae bacterium]|nr:glycosyltransferase family 2 protein [Chloroflexaceae bacterium]